MKVTNCNLALSPLLLFALGSALDIEGLLSEHEIPNSGNDWISLENGVKFQPAHDEDPVVARGIRKLTRGSYQGYQTDFVDGTETYYDEDAQAWRLLGFYIDCNAMDEVNDEQQDNRKLEERHENNVACPRFLMWAAYIDPDYQGGGIGEYRVFNRTSGTWDSTPCDTSSSTRCVKMDCHESHTHYKLLGIFKEPDINDWLEDLAMHQGSCVWTEYQNYLVQRQLGMWPLECYASSTLDENGNRLYYIAKPSRRGRIVFGLYMDAACTEEYTGDIPPRYVMDNVNERMLATSIYSMKHVEAWNEAHDMFKVCQPCKAYNLRNVEKEFQCTDVSGASGVNQCMNFAENTNMYTADFQDIELAHDQGTIVPVMAYGRKYGTAGFSAELSWSIIIFIVSFATMMVSFVTFVCVKKTNRLSYLKEPLVAPNGQVA